MTLNDFLARVLPDVPGCPSAVAKRAVIDAAKDFLTHSQIWVELQDPEPVVADVREYDLVAPSGARCIDVLNVYTRASRLRGVSLAQLAQEMPDWQSCQGNAPSHYTRALDFSAFSVYPLPVAPVADETLTVHAVYTLKDEATSLPDDIVVRWGDVIASGAKQRLMTMGGNVAWANPQLAVYHKGLFEDGRSEARITAIHGKTSGSARAQPRRFGQ